MGQLSARSIRTFVLRQGRLTEGQQRSLDQYWPLFGIDTGRVDIKSTATEDAPHPETPDEEKRIDLNRHFSTEAPVWMEIGIGNGDALATMAEQNPEVNFLGVEVHLPGVGHALGEVAHRELTNVRLIRYDVLDLIEHFMMPASIDRVLIYFPDPWHKTRHHKRRLVNAGFLDMLALLLRADGLIHFATDWEPYARQVKSVVELHPQFECLLSEEVNSEVADQVGAEISIEAEDLAKAVISLRPETHFERRGLKLGHKVTDLVIRKLPG